ncbi:MAG: hypothetical protein SFU20_09490 [Chitinophagaceae bacterium]|nr:hypothetical protein [Chitinophagaceae bacterium]
MKHLTARLSIIFFLFIASCSNAHENNAKEKEMGQLRESARKLSELLSHDTLTTHDLRSADDSSLESLVFSNIYVNINAYTKEEYGRELHSKFTIPQRDVYSTLMVERNFKAGRLFTFYDRFDFASPDAISGYNRIGFPILAKVIEDGHNLFNDMPEKKSQNFSRLDSLFIRNFDSIKSSQARVKYIRQNLDSFIQKQ